MIATPLGGSARRALRRLQTLAPRATSGVHVLAYHLVDAGTGSPVDLPRATFRRQMEELARSGRVVGLQDGLAHLAKPPTEDPAPRVVLTFDDAYDNFRSRVWPVLDELALPATLYVPTGFLDRRCPGPLTGARDHPPLAWDDLRNLAHSGLLTVGSHSDTHPDLPGLPLDRVCDELLGSQRRLEERLELAVQDFCYPRARWSRQVEAQVAGVYRSATIAGGVLNRPGSSRPLRLGRLPVRRDMPASVETLLARSVWIEEWLAARLRPWRR